MGSLYDEVKSKKKNTVVSKQKVKQTKKVVEKKYKKNYYSSGNMVKDRMSQQTYFNSKKENPEFRAQNQNLRDSRLYLTGGRAKKNIADYDGKTGLWNYTGRKDYKYQARYIQNAGTRNSVNKSKSGKVTRGKQLLSNSDMKEYERNLKKSWGTQSYNRTPVNKRQTNGKATAPIKEGFRQASKQKTITGKVGAVAGGLASGAFNGFMEVADGLNTLNYGAHGAMSGFVEGMNNNGKLDKGEIGRAFKNAGKKGKKGINAGLTKSNEGRYGFYDTFKSFSDDKKERNERKGIYLTQAQEKKRLAKLAGSGLVADIGGALLTANAGTLASKGASLVAKGSKISGNALKGLSKVAKVADLGIDLPIADLVRGSGKTLKGTKAVATNFDEVAPNLSRHLQEIGKKGKSKAINDHIVNSTVNKINKTRGVREPKYGARVAGFNVASPKTIQSIADSPLNVPGRALNSVIDKIQSTRRASGYGEDMMNSVMKKNVRKADMRGKLDYTANGNREIAMDLQTLARGNSQRDWANRMIQNQKDGVRPTTTSIDEQNLLKSELTNTPYESVRREKSMDNHFDRQLINDNTILKSIPDNIKPIIKDKPALQQFIANKTKPMRMTEQGSDKFYDYMQKNNPKMYNKFTGESDVIDDVIESTVNRKPIISDGYTKQSKPKEVKQVIEKPIMPTFSSEKIPHKQKGMVFENKISSLLKQKTDKNLIMKQRADIEKITKPLSEKTLARKDRVSVVNEMNKMLFEGKEVISHNASKKDLNQLVRAIDEGLDNSYNDVPEILNKPLGEVKKYIDSLTDDNFDMKLKQRSKEFNGATKTQINNQIKSIKQKPTMTVSDREEIRRLEKVKVDMEKWWETKGKMTPEEWENIYPNNRPELQGYNEVVEEYANKSKYDKVKFDDVVTSPKGTDEYKKQMQEWNEYKYNDLGNKDIRTVLEQKRGQAINSPLSEKELLNDIGEYDMDNITRQAKAIRQQLGLEHIKPVKAKVKLSEGQKLGTIPPVQNNIKNLRKTIEQEVELRHKNPNQYKSMEKAFKQIKTDYVSNLRALGVPDEGYFHKVKKLQDDLDVYFNELKKPKKERKGLKMDITLLSRKISDTFGEIDNHVLGYKDEITKIGENTPLDKLIKPVTRSNNPFDKVLDTMNKTAKNGSDGVKTPYDDFEEFMQNEIKKDNKRNKKQTVQKVKPTKPSVDEINEKLARLESRYGRGAKPNDEIAITSDMDNVIPIRPGKNSKIKKSKENPIKKLLKPYDALTREFKAGVTTNNPGWHAMNAIQNKMNSSYGIGGGVFNKASKNQAKDIVNSIEGQREWLGKGIGKKGLSEEELSKVKINDKYTLQDVKDVIEMEGIVDDTFVNDLGKSKGKLGQYLPSGDKSLIGGLGANKLIRTESNDKVQHILERIKGGDNISDAIGSANRTLFDYDDITKGEKEVMKRIMPFYTYYRKNIPLQLQQSANSPRAMATYMDAKNQFEKGIDDEDKQRRNEWTANRLQVPNTTMQENGKDYSMYNMMFNPSTPWDALMQLPTPSSEGINNLPSMNPILESIYRYNKGEDIFGNNYRENGKNILDVLGEGYLKPTLGSVGKLKDVKDATSKQNEQLKILEILTGIKGKYYKSNQEWDIDKEDTRSEDEKLRELKKILVRKYK